MTLDPFIWLSVGLVDENLDWCSVWAAWIARRH